MKITLRPIDETNRAAVLALSVREDQPFVAANRRSLEQFAEIEEKTPGVVRPFAICADETPVGFAMIVFDPTAGDPDDRYWLWRLMIDRNEQGRGCGQAALARIIRYFRERNADRLLLSTKPENELGLHIYHKFGFRETGEINDGETVLKLVL